MTIAIIDYGAGNLRSVQKAFQFIGANAEITRDKEAIRNAQGVILPGVGSFDATMNELRSLSLESVIDEVIALGKPFLGICLGFQHLFEASEEGTAHGLSIFKGRAVRFNFNNTPWANLSVPHMGWNRLLFKNKAPIFEGLENGAMMYFAHSYHVVPDDNLVVASRTDYGIEFVSAVWKGNVFGLQFHPEKSGEAGLKIMRNFSNLCLK